MQPKPEHLNSVYATQFQDQSIVTAYHHRPPYPMQVYEILTRLVPATLRTVLDIGCGPGQIARGLVHTVDHIDAVDWSEAMINLAQQLPDGNDPRITWTCGRAEDVPLHPPYGLVTAAASLHWMEWEIVLPRFRQALVPGSYLAIVEDSALPTPWGAALGPAIARYSTNQEYQSYDSVAELEQRNLFQRVGEQQTAPEPFTQSITDYIESFHARNGFSRDHMSVASAAAFDAIVRALVLPHASNEQITLQTIGTIVWGLPAPNLPR